MDGGLSILESPQSPDASPAHNRVQSQQHIITVLRLQHVLPGWMATCQSQSLHSQLTASENSHDNACGLLQRSSLSANVESSTDQHPGADNKLSPILGSTSWDRCPFSDRNPGANAHSWIIVVPGQMPILGSVLGQTRPFSDHHPRANAHSGICIPGQMPILGLLFSWGNCPFAEHCPRAGAHSWIAVPGLMPIPGSIPELMPILGSSISQG